MRTELGESWRDNLITHHRCLMQHRDNFPLPKSRTTFVCIFPTSLGDLLSKYALRYEELQAQRWSRQKSFPCQKETTVWFLSVSCKKEKNCTLAKRTKRQKTPRKNSKKSVSRENESFFDQKSWKKCRPILPESAFFVCFSNLKFRIFSNFFLLNLLKHSKYFKALNF